LRGAENEKQPKIEDAAPVGVRRSVIGLIYMLNLYVGREGSTLSRPIYPKLTFR
jgi:hypothetical protein